MPDESKMSKKGGAWTRVTIFISLYVLLLESVIECALVVYLYAIQRVDSKMMPSLILALASSLITVPLVILHSLAAWQYNRVTGFASQKNILHAACTYILRLIVVVWLAATVSGLVVVSQHASCLSGGNDSSFWKAGVSCALHRTVWIVSVVSFLTTCVFFCSRELCDRPYDVSLLGLYKPQPRNCDESIFSGGSWESETTLKDDVLCICRHPDMTPSSYWPADCTLDKPTCKPSIKHPTPMHPKPRLTISTGPDSCADSPRENMRRSFLGDTPADPSTVSGTPTLQSPTGIAELPTPTPGHKRSKSSFSSLKKAIHRFNPSIPLSADPDIQALSNPDLRKQDQLANPIARKPAPEPTEAKSATPPPRPPRTPSTIVPELLPQNQTTDPKIRRAYTNPMSPPPLPHPLNCHPSPATYTPYPNPAPRSPGPVHPPPPPPQPIPSQSQSPIPRPTSAPYAPVSQTQTHQPFRRSQTNLPSHHNPHRQAIPQYYNSGLRRPARISSLRGRGPASPLGDVEILYPSTRRPRSSTFAAGAGGPRRLDSIKEVPRASLEEGSLSHHQQQRSGEKEDRERSSDDSLDGSTYRGSDRTSICF